MYVFIFYYYKISGSNNSACLSSSVSTKIRPFLRFVTFSLYLRGYDFFFIRKGDNFVSEVSSYDSKMRNLGNYPLSQSPFSCEVSLFLSIEKVILYPPTMESNLMGNTKEETHLP